MVYLWSFVLSRRSGKNRKTVDLLRAKDEELLPMGAMVHYHHRAGVARFKQRMDDRDVEKKGWVLTEGIAYHNETINDPENPWSFPIVDTTTKWDNRVKYAFYNWTQA